VSGNGQLSRPQFKGAGIDSLNISLVSSQTSLNLTVVTSPEFLTQEPGSTVKHYNMPIPQCVPSGNYNVCVPVFFSVPSSKCAVVDRIRTRAHRRLAFLFYYPYSYLYSEQSAVIRVLRPQRTTSSTPIRFSSCSKPFHGSKLPALKHFHTLTQRESTRHDNLTQQPHAILSDHGCCITYCVIHNRAFGC
jgi:hypothetical protein